MHIALLLLLLASVAAPAPLAPSTTSSKVRSSPGRHAKPPVLGVVNVNRASEAELRLLPGIGRGRAHAIVERRSKRPFASLDELGRMKGMSGVVKRLRSHLVVQGDTTLRPAASGP
jgi:DNA uptake protein ComE-like DNA-binding protein